MFRFVSQNRISPNFVHIFIPSVHFKQKSEMSAQKLSSQRLQRLFPILHEKGSCWRYRYSSLTRRVSFCCPSTPLRRRQKWKHTTIALFVYDTFYNAIRVFSFHSCWLDQKFIIQRTQVTCSVRGMGFRGAIYFLNSSYLF